MKDCFQEPRPCRALPHGLLLEACPSPGDYAFPGNHTTVAFAAAAAPLAADRRPGAVTAAAAVPMGASRVHAGAHCPHGVLAAAPAGTLVALPVVPAGHRPDHEDTTGRRPLSRGGLFPSVPAGDPCLPRRIPHDRDDEPAAALRTRRRSTAPGRPAGTPASPTPSCRPKTRPTRPGPWT